MIQKLRLNTVWGKNKCFPLGIMKIPFFVWNYFGCGLTLRGMQAGKAGSSCLIRIVALFHNRKANNLELCSTFDNSLFI